VAKFRRRRALFATEEQCAHDIMAVVNELIDAEETVYAPCSGMLLPVRVVDRDPFVAGNVVDVEASAVLGAEFVACKASEADEAFGGGSVVRRRGESG
jgi:hypothetical protein